jgi:CheY-like chemotaxis protein
LLAGRKLLLADDSLAIQKVIALTFTDEGMEVTAVGDTEQALEAIDQISPDLVLADVFMPGGGGFELCERIKQSERFGRIPVMLLIGSFEPFDEAEARRVGADDVVTKPFQSIRQLVGRVGSLLGGKSGNNAGHQFSTLGIGQTEPAETHSESSHVFVEAPVMESLASEEIKEKTCEPDIEMQTADTAKLDAVDAEEAAPNFEANTNKDLGQQMIQSPISHHASDSFLELEGAGGVVTAATDDFILDLDGDAAIAVPSYTAAPFVVPVIEEAPPEPFVEPFAEPEEQPVVAEVESVAPVAAAVVEEKEEAPVTSLASSELSAETIDAIARRVVEQLSDKVVREIAWEVVPDLAELLIKKKLEEQK